LKAVCLCGVRLFTYTTIYVDPNTGYKLCKNCGEPKIIEARRVKSLRRKHRKLAWKIFIIELTKELCKYISKDVVKSIVLCYIIFPKN